jgi:protein phosphatase/serine/threonine-protein phosphatase Stp1
LTLSAQGSRLSSKGVTHPGMVRTRNEDSLVERDDLGLWAVADGAGGHGAGDVASGAVADALKCLPTGLSAGEVLAQVRLRMAAVHQDLQQRTSPEKSHLTPVTTVVVVLARDDHFACLWAGDSRAYLMRAGVLCQLTEDHSLLQELIKSEVLKPEEAENHPQANVITRAVGGPEDLVLDKVAGRLQSGDRLLLCTDGLFKALPEARIEEILRSGGGPDELLAQSLAAGAKDNVTALVVGF